MPLTRFRPPTISEIPGAGTDAAIDSVTGGVDVTVGRGLILPALVAQLDPKIWNSDNFQQDTPVGLKTKYLMQNVSGGNLADASLISGSSLKIVFLDNTGTPVFSGAAIPGTWKNVSFRTIGINESGWFTRDI